MNGNFSKHSASKEHLACYITWKEKTKRLEMGKNISSIVNTEAIDRNRCYFSNLIDIVAFLATHQLPFRPIHAQTNTCSIDMREGSITPFYALV